MRKLRVGLSTIARGNNGTYIDLSVFQGAAPGVFHHLDRGTVEAWEVS